MLVMLGDYVTLSRSVGEDSTEVSGRVSGIVLDDAGGLKYVYVKGLDSSLWMNDGWNFETEIEEGNDDE
jgi:hypothetical protein